MVVDIQHSHHRFQEVQIEKEEVVEGRRGGNADITLHTAGCIPEKREAQSVFVRGPARGRTWVQGPKYGTEADCVSSNGQ